MLGWKVPSASISPNPPAISKTAPKPNRTLCQLLSLPVSVLSLIFGCLFTSVRTERGEVRQGFIVQAKFPPVGQ